MTDITLSEKFHSNGKLASREYRNAAGELHRDPLEGPAVEFWYENGTKLYTAYWVNDKPHRDIKDGPSYVHCDIDGMICEEAYFMNGVEFSSKDVATILLQERISHAELALDTAVAQLDKMTAFYKAKNKTAGEKISELILERKLLKARVKELELLLNKTTAQK